MDVLVSWIGDTDFKSLYELQDYKLTETIKAEINDTKEYKPADGGPLTTMLFQGRKHDKVFLLSNRSEYITSAYINNLDYDVELIYKKVKDPSDYKEIYSVSVEALEEIFKLTDRNCNLSLFLSPGTPTMAAIWVLLGKTKYPATFWKSWKTGAFEVDIPFDITMDVVPELIQKADKVFNHLMIDAPSDIEGFESITGDSKAIRLAVGRARKAAVRDVSVLLSGESGTGKELFANAMHKASLRKDKPFVAINCAAIPAELLESELFGHVKGAFTGANKDTDGAFKQADGGVLFLDEIGECTPALQTKLLRVLQPPHGKASSIREFSRVGSSDIITSDVRIIAATNKNLIEMIKDNTFREDLFYRLAMIIIKLPTLRDRKADIPKLADVILCQINTEFKAQDKNYKDKYFCCNTKTFIKKYSWPGNVRELKNVLIQSVVMSDGEELSVSDIESALSEQPGFVKHKQDLLETPLDNDFKLMDHLNMIQKHYLKRALTEASGKKTRAAEMLGFKNYQTLDAQLKKFDIDINDYKK